MASTGCGTLLYPQRRGQPSGWLDWEVVALDALGLLLFVIPGIIAFAVDFSTGAIFLPPCGCPQFSDNGRRQALETKQLARNQLSRAGIEHLVSAHLGRDVKLEPGKYHTSELSDVDHFWPATDQLLAANNPLPAADDVFRCQSP